MVQFLLALILLAVHMCGSLVSCRVIFSRFPTLIIVLTRYVSLCQMLFLRVLACRS